MLVQGPWCVQTQQAEGPLFQRRESLKVHPYCASKLSHEALREREAGSSVADGRHR